MAVLSSTRHDPLRGFKYRVEITLPQELGGNAISVGFQRVSGLREETEVVEYRNGDETGGVRKLPGITSYDNVVMERGQLLNGSPDSTALSDWRRLIQTLERDGIEVEDNLRGSFTVSIYRRGKNASTDTPDFFYVRQQVWPAIYEHSDLDGTASDVWLERVEFAVEAGGQGTTTSGI